MKTWKITNTSNQPIKIGLITSNTTSKGVIIAPGEFCLTLPQLTASIDSQKRKGFVQVEEAYENVQNLELGVSFKQDVIKPTKMEEAEKNAVEYIKKS